jgi:formylmethanofuran dehydrogenase subunit E
MYKTLRNENANISPEDARDRIEKDCVGIWVKRTILDALPDEAKNQEKQKAGRLRQKEHNSAAFSAAPSSPQQEEKKKKIVVAAVQGKSVEEDIQRASDLFSTNNSSLSEDSTANSNSIQAHLQHHKAISDLKECSSCHELQAENNELKDALRKATKLTTGDQINKPSSSSDKGIQLENSSNISDFEFSLPLEGVRQYIIRSFNVYKIKDQIWFSGTIDKSTGKVLTATTGRKSQHSTIEDRSKDDSSNSSSSNGSSYYRFHH